MRIGIYTLDKADMEAVAQFLPDYVVERAHEPGYFSLGAVAKVDGEDRVVGISQFYIDINSSGECFAFLIYNYVMEDFRRNGVGTRLIDKIGSILKKSDIKMCVACLPNKKDVFLYSITPKAEVESFIKECDFMVTKEEIVGETFTDVTENSTKYVRLTGR